MAIVLATGPKVRGFKLGRERCIFNGNKNRSTTSFGEEVKPSAPCCKILLHVKDPLRYDSDTGRQNSAAISRPFHPASLLGVSAATRADNSGGLIGND
jgi:hypothetical protein